MPDISAIAEAIPDLPSYFQKWLFSPIACDILINADEWPNETFVIITIELSNIFKISNACHALNFFFILFSLRSFVVKKGMKRRYIYMRSGAANVFFRKKVDIKLFFCFSPELKSVLKLVLSSQKNELFCFYFLSFKKKQR